MQLKLCPLFRVLSSLADLHKVDAKTEQYPDTSKADKSQLDELVRYWRASDTPARDDNPSSGVEQYEKDLSREYQKAQQAIREAERQKWSNQPQTNHPTKNLEQEI